MPHAGDGARWIVLREGAAPRWGGEVRRHHVFGGLVRLAGAQPIEAGWRTRSFRRALVGPLGSLPGPLGLLPASVARGAARLARRRPPDRPRLASSEKLRDNLLDAAIALTDPVAVAVYDDPAAQASALGVTLDANWLAELRRRQERNVRAFRWLVVPTRSFADLAGLDPDRVVVGGNGTVASRVRPGPWPSRPCVGVVSAAAPGRGLELLVDAARAARSTVTDLRLMLWLVSTGPSTDAYLASLRSAVAREPWIGIGQAAYHELGAATASATALCIPHPPNEYLDAALPVKLFDSMAVGRPLVVTPRTETAAVVRAGDVGVVAAGDGVDDLAAAIVSVVADDARAREMGRRAREVAEREFDWTVVGDRIAQALLDREDGRRGGAEDAVASGPDPADGLSSA